MQDFAMFHAYYIHSIHETKLSLLFIRLIAYLHSWSQCLCYKVLKKLAFIHKQKTKEYNSRCKQDGRNINISYIHIISAQKPHKVALLLFNGRMHHLPLLRRISNSPLCARCHSHTFHQSLPVMTIETTCKLKLMLHWYRTFVLFRIYTSQSIHIWERFSGISLKLCI